MYNDWWKKVDFLLRWMGLTLIAFLLWMGLTGCGNTSQEPEDVSLSGITLDGIKYVMTEVVNNKPVYGQQWNTLWFKDETHYRWTWGPRFLDTRNPAVPEVQQLQTGAEEGNYDTGQYHSGNQSFFLSFSATRSDYPMEVGLYHIFEVFHDPTMNTYTFFNMNWHMKGAIPKPITK
mgnify:FL=1